MIDLKQLEFTKNPNFLEMSSIKNKTNYKELRGLLVGGISVYIWDANLATYGDVIALLDEYTDFNSFIVDQDNTLLAADPNTDINKLYTIPMIKRMLNI
jgi:hypothetical protein